MFSSTASQRRRRRRWRWDRKKHLRRAITSSGSRQQIARHDIASLHVTGAFNLSSVQFDDCALAVLNCGLKFIPTPAAKSVSGASDQAIDAFARNVRLRFHFSGVEDDDFDPRFHISKPEFQPDAAPTAVEQFLLDIRIAVSKAYRAARSLHVTSVPNLNDKQQAALTSLINDKSLVIKPADKNLGLVIMDKIDYDSLLMSVLQDGRQFTAVTTPDISQLKGALQRLLDRWQNELPTQVYSFLSAQAATTFRFPHPYALPKLHKLPAVDRSFMSQLTARVICPCHSWVTTGLSQFLADLLNDVCSKKFPHVLPDSRTMIRQLDGQLVSRDSVLVTYDVVDMYPSIDNDTAIIQCAAATAGPMRMMVEQLLRFVLSNMYCQRNDITYQQTSGVVMGTACAPPVTNIYMAADFEASARQLTDEWPRFYFRLIDDGFFIWEHNLEALSVFQQLLSSLKPNIRLVFQQDITCIPYLDVYVAKDMSVPGALVPIVFSTYQKPHNKYLYIPFQSHHRSHVFSAFVRGELIRYVITNTLLADFLKMADLFKTRLVARGYPITFLQPIFDAIHHSDRRYYLRQQQQRQQRQQRATTGTSPAMVVVNDISTQSRMNLSKVINDVYCRYKPTVPELHQLFGDKIVVAYKNPPNLSRLLVRAAD